MTQDVEDPHGGGRGDDGLLTGSFPEGGAATLSTDRETAQGRRLGDVSRVAGACRGHSEGCRCRGTAAPVERSTYVTVEASINSRCKNTFQNTEMDCYASLAVVVVVVFLLLRGTYFLPFASRFTFCHDLSGNENMWLW